MLNQIIIIHVKSYERKNDEAALENFYASSNTIYSKFCATQGHPMNKCNKFPSYETKIDR